MAQTEAEIKSMLSKVDAEIEALLTGDGSGLVNYTAGGRRVDKTSRLAELRAARKELLAQLAGLPSEEASLFDDPAL